MDAKVSVSLLIEKLQDFLRGQAATSNPLFKKKVQTTINNLHSFEQFLQDAEDREALSGCWSMNDQTVARVLKAIYSADDATDTLLIRNELQQIRFRRRENQTSPFIFSLTSLCSHILFIHEMKKFMNEVRRLEKKKEKAVTRDNATISRLLSFENDQEYGWRWLFLEETNYFVGPEQKMNELFIRLKPHEFPKVIAVVGEGGLGKTTLASTLYNRVDVRRNFTNRAWVQVPSLFDSRYVLADILRQINQVDLVVESTLSEDELMVRIGELLNGGRCLVVLEGVSVESSQILATLLNSSQFDARIIITTRIVLNLPYQATYLTLRLGRLNEEQSWKLFLNKVRMAEADYMTNNSQLITFKKQILKVCGGLPSAIVLLAGLLSTKRQDYDDWYRVIVRASNNKGDILALCYHDLPSEIKPCFLYMGIFPRKAEIPVRRLIHLWVAEGFVMPSDPEKTNHEDVAERCFKELVIRNMIQVRRKSDGSPKTCYMPGFLYDFFSSKAEAVGFFHTSCVSTDKQSELAAVRRLAGHSGMINNFPSAFLQNLRSFVAFNTQIHAGDVGMFLNKIISNRGFGLLYMLDLEGLYKPMLSDDVIRKLIHLKYLGLRSTFIDSLPDAVPSLPCLETLDVKHTNISNVIHIDKAEKLRHLYLFENSSDKVRLDLRSITNLQTLCGVNIESLSELTELQKLTRLGKLKLTGPGNMIGGKEMSECISKLTKLQFLKLRCKDNSYISLDLSLKEHEYLRDLYLVGLLSQERFDNLFPPYLRKLTLLSSRINVNDQLLVLGQLPHLNILRLFCDSYFGKQLIFPSEAFPNLLILKLRSLPNLEEWIVEEGAMKYLNRLEIRDCKHLKQPQGLVNLKFLKELVITNMTMGFGEAVEEILRGRNVYQSSIKVGPWGGLRGRDWSYMPKGGIVEIVINHGDIIDSLSFKSVYANKEAESSINFGGKGGNKRQLISIDWPEEYLTSISGTIGKFYTIESCVESLTFYTNWHTHGPFGSSKGTHFSLPVENRVIAGFHGRAGLYIDAIGVYQKTATSIQGHL
ncbi:hypothetical protein LWI29_031321 [Acer saccharum]|uniref:Jacalin-type lectin domain-containing protein n=1 Tax=Acer saccharum TaxID=4024 RepID=A0AA39SXH8_ACESA|nr:hypothetical protein LWI29_031321 [Acer saccharum]